MTLRHMLALSFAAALFSFTAAGAQAATTHRATTHRPMHTRGHMARSATSMPTGADHSADSLNAQSLTRAQGGGQ